MGNQKPNNDSTHQTISLDFSVIEELDQMEIDGKRVLLEQMSQIFFETVPQSLKHIKESLLSTDLEGIVFEAHKLRSTSGTLGAVQMNRLCTLLEQEARKHASPDVAPLVTELEAEAQKVFKELKAYLTKQRALARSSA